MKRRWLASLLVLSASLVLCTQCQLFPAVDSAAVARALATQPDDHVLGAAGARITVVEYADFECSFCGQFARQTFPTIKQQYVDTGKVLWVYRHFPLQRLHPCAETAAEVSECASDQGRFFEFADQIYQAQDALLTFGASGCTADLSVPAQAVGLDFNALQTCNASGTKAARVQRDLSSGTAAGVPGTPCFFINGKQVAGFLTVSEFRALLDK